jgi:tRNA modification GTPase
LSEPLSDADREVLAATSGKVRLIVGNKSDLLRPGQSSTDLYPVDLMCSALTGSGIPDLMKRLSGSVEERTGYDGNEGGIVVSLRVLALLGTAKAALRRAAAGLNEAPVEAALMDLRDALGVIDGIVGGKGDEAVLDRIFSSFCVGK